VCQCGPKNREELQDALKALNAPLMDDQEMAWMRRIGAVVYNRQHHNALLRRLIFD
jgi:hypothetical protein